MKNVDEELRLEHRQEELSFCYQYKNLETVQGCLLGVGRQELQREETYIHVAEVE